ncbi:MAG: low affinity iron permease family protein [Ginsengibacter sp.]
MNKDVISENVGNTTNPKTGQKNKNRFSTFFNSFSTKVTKITGGVYAFVFALIVVIIWAATGPLFHYSDTWQLVINTSTTIVTFLMVFIIQHSQNKDTIALQLKLNELIAVSKASNKLISVENLSDEELQKINDYYSKVSINALQGKMNNSICLDDAEINLDGSDINIESQNVDIHISQENLNQLKTK